MRKVYVIGTACTPFGKHEDKSFSRTWPAGPMPICCRIAAWTPMARG